MTIFKKEWSASKKQWICSIMIFVLFGAMAILFLLARMNWWSITLAVIIITLIVSITVLQLVIEFKDAKERMKKGSKKKKKKVTKN